MKDRSKDALEGFHVAQLQPRDLVSPNFRAYELNRSMLAARQGIDNGFASDDILRAAVHLAREVLQPVRDAFGAFSPNSVYRSQALERALKHRPATWISTSQHTAGCACDIEIPGMATLDLARWAAAHLADFDQIICECYDPRLGPNAGWVHISLRAPGTGENRRNELSYIRHPDSGRMVYVSGLRATVA
ncbi:hypothetical protein G3580_02190 [Nitrogeniibacter mangrovi]|uniref:Peptidase M15A C-terminal domain-containing protein n=1 Tax=Nitrogeniibacter mangrovi TaxID=2016596 RepID=A0A6C1B2G7_9RHOO|nr:D-Ala-D-Ala carboxypeptidase family metallohydrolase [Nitrogeniibacter mangrovi]QID16540.1 hypothetical protein G3580_02190 [Nitrogeniibacter mangrovi]